MTDLIRHTIDIGPWLLTGNDDAPTHGRVHVFTDCPMCGHGGTAMSLWAGVWSVEHRHGRPWTAHLLSVGGDPAPAARGVTAGRVRDAALLADVVLAAHTTEAATA